MTELSQVDLVHLDRIYANKLYDVAETYFIDTEAMHVKYDALLVELLNMLQMTETVEQYVKESNHFWYA